MEPTFKTSFIPKQSLASGSKPRRSMSVAQGLVGALSLVIFVASIVTAGGLFFYTKYLESSLQSKQEQLVKARAAFQPETIAEIARLDERLKASRTLLDGHVAPSVLFALLEQITLTSVRFSEFLYTHGPGGVSLELTGIARDFAGLALQSDVFGDSQILRNPVVREFTLAEGAGVSFVITADVETAFIKYEPTLEPVEIGEDAAAPVAEAPTEVSGPQSGGDAFPSESAAPTEDPLPPLSSDMPAF